MAIDKRITALEAEAAFDAAAQAMGGWDELRRWAAQNKTHCREIIRRFVPDDVLKEGSGPTLEDLVAGSCYSPDTSTDEEES